MKSTLVLFAAAALTVTGCGTYEPPSPGRHAAPGEVVAESSCSYETPTATRFQSLRCRSAEDRKRDTELSRETADSLRTLPPEIK